MFFNGNVCEQSLAALVLCSKVSAVNGMLDKLY